jgi:putative hydrolase of the HAD superfamily
MTPRAIFFDAVGTLIHPEPAAALVYANAGRRFGSRRRPDVIAQRFRNAFQKQEAVDRDNGWITSEQRELARWQAIVGEVLDDVTDPRGCFDFLYHHFAMPQSWRCDPGAESLFEDLLAREYQLGLASNYDARLYDLVRGLKPLRLLQHVVVSFEVGYRKPAPAFFQVLCERTGLAPAEILHVGDDPDNDCAGALAAGMSAVLLDPFDRHADWSGPRIGALADVKKFLLPSL